MDYPKSVEGNGLVGGKFVDENPATGQIGSLIPAVWGNSVTDEILNVIRAGGLTPSETQVNQLLQAIQQLAAIGSPTGMIAFIHSTDVPDGWLLCNGAAVSRTTYANLFAKIGVKYGSGNGSTTFNLPNLDGRVLQGTTNTGNVGTYLEASLPNIKGGFSVAGLTSSKVATITGAFYTTSNYADIGCSNGENPCLNLHIDASKSSATYIENGKLQAPALQVLPCIRI